VHSGEGEEVKGSFDEDKESDQDKYEDFDPMFDLIVRIDTMKSTY
jgi:hypothetical protein